MSFRTLYISMKIYFIRHAPTSSNMSGTMTAGYENADITLLDKPDDWEERVGCQQLT